jgi:hypothetical protein
MSAIQAAVQAGFAVSVVAQSCVPADATVLTPEQGFAALPAVTIILATSTQTDGGLVARLGEQMRAHLQRMAGH